MSQDTGASSASFLTAAVKDGHTPCDAPVVTCEGVYEGNVFRHACILLPGHPGNHKCHACSFGWSEP